MMKTIQIVSDLHAEFMIPMSIYDTIASCPADFLIVAGDLGNSNTICRDLVALMDSIQKSDYPNKKVIYVPGNHEYYKSYKYKVDAKLKEINIDNLYILIQDVVTIDGITFIGATGWWDESSYPITDKCIYGMNDFAMIADIGEHNNGIDWGKEAYIFFKNNLEIHKNKPVICISHNGPSLASIPNRFMGSPLNACFSNNWHHLMENYTPRLWAHGHTHDSFDYNVNLTRVICNPYGYFEFEPNKQYNPWKIVEIDI